MRLFVALDVPHETRAALDPLVRRFEKICGDARWVRLEGVHITLKFLGEVDDAQGPEIQSALSSVRQDKSVPIVFRDFGYFPNDHHPRVFWAGIESGPELAALAAKVGASLEPFGFPQEKRTFSPHLTLARFKTLEGLAKLKEAVASLPSRDFGQTSAVQFHLYQSVLKSSGAVYNKLASYSFVESASS
ncbi:MAG TPA: RNA 2',3'-cyclic phosphodiesterase [Candidatus Acidoferrales bacterium]|nr:RNA 2',3'-cyclic phosphodiesterase [Candidatus Acidoferrales bacterium]